MLLIISYDNIRHMSEKVKYLNSPQEIEKKYHILKVQIKVYKKNHIINRGTAEWGNSLNRPLL